MGHLKENTGPVTGARVAALRAAMSKVIQDFQALLDYGVGFMSLQVGDEPDSASVFLEFRIVKSLPFREPWDIQVISYSLCSGSRYS